MNEEEERLRLEKELGVRELAPEEIQAMHNHSKEIENLVREKYPEYFASGSPGTHRHPAKIAQIRRRFGSIH
jgi:hypothetical protein